MPASKQSDATCLWVMWHFFVVGFTAQVGDRPCCEIPWQQCLLPDCAGRVCRWYSVLWYTQERVSFIWPIAVYAHVKYLTIYSDYFFNRLGQKVNRNWDGSTSTYHRTCGNPSRQSDHQRGWMMMSPLSVLLSCPPCKVEYQADGNTGCPIFLLCLGVSFGTCQRSSFCREWVIRYL